MPARPPSRRTLTCTAWAAAGPTPRTRRTPPCNTTVTSSHGGQRGSGPALKSARRPSHASRRGHRRGTVTGAACLWSIAYESSFISAPRSNFNVLLQNSKKTFLLKKVFCSRPPQGKFVHIWDTDGIILSRGSKITSNMNKNVFNEQHTMNNTRWRDGSCGAATPLSHHQMARLCSSGLMSLSSHGPIRCPSSPTAIGARADIICTRLSRCEPAPMCGIVAWASNVRQRKSEAVLDLPVKRCAVSCSGCLFAIQATNFDRGWCAG